MKSPEVQKIGDRSIDLGANKYQTFKDIDRKQVSISKFVVASEKKEEEIKERPPNLKTKPSTPIRTKIRRFEEKANSPGVSRTSRSIKKSRPEPKVQSIRKFFMSPLKKT